MKFEIDGTVYTPKSYANHGRNILKTTRMSQAKYFEVVGILNNLAIMLNHANEQLDKLNQKGMEKADEKGV